MRPISILALCLALVVQEFHALAQVPHVMTYQGRVASGGTNFSGTGQFKFALVSGGTSAAAQANASVTVFFGFVVQIAVTSGGAGYMAAPAVTITDSSGSGASAIAQIANGQVTGITVTDAGSGYSASPSITIAPPAVNLSYTTYWSHDGTSSAGGEPASAVPVSVSQGLFTVGLGDTLIPNMNALPPQVLANSDVRLRMWFNDGLNGFSQLSPDQRLTSTAYAMMADTVRDGAITAAKLAPNSITSAQIAPGSIMANQLADGAVTSAKLAANVNAGAGAPAGSILLSPDPAASNLLSAGFTRLNSTVKPNEWEISVAELDSDFRFERNQSAVWTGSEVILWGGGGDSLQSSGAIYRPSENQWRPTSSIGPSARNQQTAVWTGSEMIIWGGFNGTTVVGDGARYNPTGDVWRAVSMTGAPAARSGHTAVWTGTEMIVWGGNNAQGVFNSGARYDPSQDRWLAMSSNAPAPRGGHVAVWTGTEMFVWGGGPDDGGRYDPKSDSWRSITTFGAPGSGSGYLSSWTGSEMSVWLPTSGEAASLYNPASDQWRRLPRMPSFYFGERPYSTWTGDSFIVVTDQLGESSVGAAIYHLGSNSWTLVPDGEIPGIREGEYFAPPIWTGRGMLTFLSAGGLDRYTRRYTPSAPLYLYQKQ